MNLKISKPWFVENSKIPVILSFFAPITISAITLGPIVFSRDKMSDTTKNHEAIHWQQYIELGIIGFPILYVLFWLFGYAKYRDGKLAYAMIPFEQEAYEFESDELYLIKRKRYNWVKIKI